MFTLNVRSPSFLAKLSQSVREQLASRSKLAPRDYDLLMAARKENYGRHPRKLQVQFDEVRAGVYFLRDIGEQGQRQYMRMEELGKAAGRLSEGPGKGGLGRIAQLTRQMEESRQNTPAKMSMDKFYLKDMKTRQDIVSNT